MWESRKLIFCCGLLLLTACQLEESPGAALEVQAGPAFSSRLRALHSGKCIDVPRSSASSGTELIQWSCHGRDNQRFGFYPVDKVADTYLVKNEASGLCLDISQRARDGLHHVIQWNCHGRENQQFTLRPAGGAFALVARHSGKCIDVMRASRDDRAALLEYRCHGGANQQFDLSGYAGGGAPEETLTLVAAGDIACDPTADSAYNGGAGTADRCRMRYTAEVAASLSPDAVLVLGDLQYNTGQYEEFLESYDPTWGRLKAVTYPVPGNHEYDSGSAGYFKYFGSRAGDPAKGYYSFDLGDWHVVMLNTNMACAVVSCAAGSAQERWLRDDLAATDKRCVVAAMHHPRYSSGRHGGYGAVDALWRALAEGGADLVLTAHDHHYERFAPLDRTGQRVSAGLRQFIVGTGGKSLYDIKGVQAQSEKVVAQTYGVLELELAENGYDWAFISETGARLDTGSAACN